MPTEAAAANPAVPPAVSVVFGIIWLLFILGIIASYVIMLIAGWRLMKAHEKLAEKVGQVSEKIK